MLKLLSWKTSKFLYSVKCNNCHRIWNQANVRYRSDTCSGPWSYLRNSWVFLETKCLVKKRQQTIKWESVSVSAVFIVRMYFFYSIKKTIAQFSASAASSCVTGVSGEQRQQGNLDRLPSRSPAEKCIGPQIGSGVERIRGRPAGIWTGPEHVENRFSLPTVRLISPYTRPEVASLAIERRSLTSLGREK